MQILIAVESNPLQRKILDVLENEKAIIALALHADISMESQLSESICMIITGTDPKDLERQNAIISLSSKYPGLCLLAVGPPEHSAELFNWLWAGAAGALLETEIATCLLTIIRQLNWWLQPFSAVLSRQLITLIPGGKVLRKKETDYGLTVREKQVLKVIVKGLNYKMIAHKLNISRETVRAHVKSIYRKLKVSSLTEMVARAINEELI